MPKLAKQDDTPQLYQPTDREAEIIGAIWSQWEKARGQRMSTYRYFNDRDFETYVNDSVDRFNGYIEPRLDPAGDWGAKVFNNVTRNKSVAIIAQITAERTKPEFFPQNQDDPEDIRAAQLIERLEQATYFKNKDDEQQFYATLEAAVKGTAIGYEGYKLERREIKEITKYNLETGEVEYETKTIDDWDDVFGDVIPLFDFYPGNIWVRDIQRQPFIFWRTVMDEDQFQQEYGGYRHANLVRGRVMADLSTTDDRSRETLGSAEDGSVTFERISSDIREGQVEVLKYFNRFTDEFHILANAVLLTRTVSPFPWDHKMYPFWKAIFEPFSIDFFYGKSLPDKLRSNQDVLNTLYRMMLDQSYLSINPPIFTTSVEDIRDEGLWPGRRLPVDDIGNTKVFEIPAPNQAHFSIIKMVEDNMNKEAIDDPSSGTTGSRTTAFEVGVAKEAAQKLLSLFLRCMEWGVRDKAELRVKNILQFYRLPRIKELANGDEVLSYRQVIMDQTTLKDGTRGRHVIQIVGPEQRLPTPPEITQQEVGLLVKTGQNVAYSFITTQKLRSLDLKITIVPNSSVKMSKALQRALELEYQQRVNLLYPDMLNREEAFRQFNEAFDKNPEKMISGGGEMPPGATPPGGVQPKEGMVGPAVTTPNSAATAGVPNANTTQNSLRNVPVA